MNFDIFNNIYIYIFLLQLRYNYIFVFLFNLDKWAVSCMKPDPLPPCGQEFPAHWVADTWGPDNSE